MRVTLDGVPGFWLEASIAGRYAAVVGRLLTSERRRHPDAAPPLDLLLSQYVLLGSANGTEMAPEATNTGCSSCGSGGLEMASQPLGVGDVSTLLRCSRRAVTKAISVGRLTATKNGRQWLISEADLQDFKRKRAQNDGSD